MKTCRITARRRIEIQDIEDDYHGIPSNVIATHPALVTVKLEIACLCGSDSPFFNYDFEVLADNPLRPYQNRVDYSNPYPLNPGLSLHVCVGTIVETASDRFRVGQRVLALPYDQHGFFEFLALPEDRIFELPETDVPKEELLMCQPLGTILYGLRKLAAIEGKRFAIIGQGPIGLMMTQLLKRRGAREIIAIEKIPERRCQAIQMGADQAIDHDQESLEAISGRAEIIIEAVGHHEATIQTAVQIAPQDGSVFTFGVIDHNDTAPFPYSEAFHKNLTLLHSVGAQHAEHFNAAAQLIADRKFDVRPLLTHRFAIEQTQEAYETFVDRRDGVSKALLDFEV